jgi:hypothetical protein
MDNPMHCGVLLGAVGETVVLLGVLWETVVLLVVDGFDEVEPDALGGDGRCDSHPAMPAQTIAMMAISRTGELTSVVAHFAGDAVTVEVETDPVTRLSLVNRRRTGSARRSLLRRWALHEAWLGLLLAKWHRLLVISQLTP